MPIKTGLLPIQYMLRGMKKPVLVLISGTSGTGKTVLARRLAASLPVVVLEKDAIKETLFDALGGGDRDWSRKLGTAAFELLRVLVGSHLRAGQSVVVEANFQLSFEAPWIDRVRSEYDVDVLELHCHTDLETALGRVARRDDSGERHAAHRVGDSGAELRDGYHFYGPVTDGDGFILIDTTDFAAVDYAAFEERVMSSIAWSG